MHIMPANSSRTGESVAVRESSEIYVRRPLAWIGLDWIGLGSGPKRALVLLASSHLSARGDRFQLTSHPKRFQVRLGARLLVSCVRFRASELSLQPNEPPLLHLV